MPTVYAFQTDTAWHSAAGNYRTVAEAIARAAPSPGSMIVLPEMFDVGFSMDHAHASAAAKDTVAFLADTAQATRCTIVAGHAELDVQGRPTNGASVFNPEGRRVARYVKCHGFSPAGEHESYVGGDGPLLFDWAGLKVAPLVCYDLRFPELFRAGLKLGAEMFVVIANWPSARVEHWVTLAKARAIENLAYVVALNRCGSDPKYTYPGRSLIVDPRGTILAEAGEGVEQLACQIDADHVRSWRRDFPAIRDARFL